MNRSSLFIVTAALIAYSGLASAQIAPQQQAPSTTQAPPASDSMSTPPQSTPTTAPSMDQASPPSTDQASSGNKDGKKKKHGKKDKDAMPAPSTTP